MRVTVYILSLFVSALIYFLFATYMSVSAGLSSWLPLVSFYSAIITFGFFSWLHFFYPKLGAILLTIALVLMFLTWPVFLLIEHFRGGYKPMFFESLVPLALIVASIILVWVAYIKGDKVKHWLKYALAIPPAFLSVYVAAHFTIVYFGAN